MEKENLQKLIEVISSAIEALPNPPREPVKKEFEKIKEQIMENRPPRIMIVGRRGAGKSSLINAIFDQKVAEVGPVVSETGESKWYYFKNKKGEIHILDTRGIGDKTKPESANFEEAIEEIQFSVKQRCPDVILFLCKAKEVDSHIEEDLKNIKLIKWYINNVHKYNSPLSAVITQVDELDPIRVSEPPYKHPKKQNNIDEAVLTIQGAFKDNDLDLIKAIPVSAYAEYENGEKVYDNYWNIAVLVNFLMDILPNTAQLQLARLSSITRIQIKFARSIVGSTAIICSGIAATPIPVADIVPITAAQVGMIIGIGHVSGRDMSKESAKEFIAALGINIGAGFALREISRALAKIVFPGAGHAVSAGVAFAGTWAIGEAAIAYFIQGKSIKESKEIFNKVKEEKKERLDG